MVAESKRRLATNNIFTNIVMSLLTTMLVFETPVTSFCIHKQDPLVMDICLSQGRESVLVKVGNVKKSE